MDYKKINQSLLCVILVFLSYVINAQAVTDTDSSSGQEQAFRKDKQLFAKAVTLSEQKQWLKAEAIYRDLIKRNKNWPEPKNNLAIVLLKTDRMDEARLMLEQAITSSPSYRIAQKNRTQLYNYLAAEAYDKALGTKKILDIPEMTLIKRVNLPVKVIEKTIEKTVEKRVEVVVEKPVIVERIVEKTVTRPESETPAINLDTPDITSTSSGANLTETELVKEPGVNEIVDTIEQQLTGWSRAWSQGNFDLYIKSYSDRFQPSDDRKTFAEWKNIRRGRLIYAKDVNVSFEQLRVFVEPQGEFVLAEFIQNYRSMSYSDKVLKQMYMQKEQNNWRILSERTIKTL